MDHLNGKGNSNKHAFKCPKCMSLELGSERECKSLRKTQLDNEKLERASAVVNLLNVSSID